LKVGVGDGFFNIPVSRSGVIADAAGGSIADRDQRIAQAEIEAAKAPKPEFQGHVLGRKRILDRSEFASGKSPKVHERWRELQAEFVGENQRRLEGMVPATADKEQAVFLL